MKRAIGAGVEAGSHVEPGGAMQIIMEAAGLGVRLSAQGDELVVNGNTARLDPAFVERLKLAKPELIAMLGASSPRQAEPVIVGAPDAAGEPFPLTQNQQAYWVGRSGFFSSSSVSIQLYVELDCEDLDHERFEAAWRRVVGRHDMLRAVLLPTGEQRVLADPPVWSLPVDDLGRLSTEARRAALAEMRERLSHHLHPLESWPTWTVRAARYGRTTRVFFAIDCWAVDGRSWQIVFADLVRAYLAPDESLRGAAIGFRDYVLAINANEEGEAFRRDLDYWLERLKVLPGPPPVPTADGGPPARSRFRRRTHSLNAAGAAVLKRRAAAFGVTLPATLLAAYAAVLDRWSGCPHFTVNVPRWNRPPLHPDIDHVVGEFATFSLLEIDNRNSGDFAGQALRVQRQLWRDLDHDRVSGVRALREWRRARSDAPANGVPFVFTVEADVRGDDYRSRAWRESLRSIGSIADTLTQTPQVWIDCQYDETDDVLSCHWDCVDAAFPDGLADTMFAAFAGLLDALADEDDAKSAWRLPPFASLPSDQTESRRRANDTTRADPTREPWRALVEHAARRGGEEALVDPTHRLTWSGLETQVSALAARLALIGAAPGVPVAIALPKGVAQVISALAVHRVGAVIVAIDVTLPEARFRHILSDSGAIALVADQSGTPVDPDCGLPIVAIDPAAAPDAGDVERGRALPAPSPDRLHSIIYTSGSTGAPKGVMVPWPGVLNMMADAQERFALGEDDAVLAVAPMHHDLSLFDIFGCTLAGCRIVALGPDDARNPQAWLAQMRAERVTLWNSVPAMLVMLLDIADFARRNGADAGLPHLRLAVLGGDWIPLSLPDRLSEFAPAELYSSGGPTETTGWNILHRFAGHQPGWRSIPYGRPIRNVRYHVLDPLGRDCPDWVAGELCCTGAGVTLGYLNDPERSASVFVAHPTTRESMCRTGDLGRYRPDGVIEFLGRADSQIQINGVRVELGEIESQLETHPSVACAVVLPLKDGPIVRELAAAVTLRAGEATSDVEGAIRAHLAARLSRLVIPGRISVIAAMPLTANGKIDRPRLAQTIAGAVPETGPWRPEGADQELVARRWEDLLGRPPRSADESLFEAGGDSLTAIRLFTSLLADRVRGSSVMTVFAHPTVAALADLLDAGQVEQAGPALPELPPITPIGKSRPSIGPATSAQRRLALDQAAIGDDAGYNLAFAIEIEGDVDPERLRQALGAVQGANAPLRTLLRTTATGDLVQEVLDETRVRLEAINLQFASPEALAEARLELARRPIDPSRDLPLIATLVRKGPRESELVLVCHHSAIDGAAFSRIYADLAAALRGENLVEAALQPLDYAAWERLPAVQAHRESGVELREKQLAALREATTLETGRTRPSRRPFDSDQAFADLSPDEVASIRTLSGRLGVSPFTLGLAALSALLARWSGRDDVVIGTHSSLRRQENLAAAPGMYVNLAVLALDTPADASFEAHARAAQAALHEASAFADVPFELLVERWGGARDASVHPLYRIALSQEGLSYETSEAGGLRLHPPQTIPVRTNFDLEFTLRTARDDEFRLSCLYAASLFDRETAGLLIAQWRALLAAATADPGLALKDLAAATGRAGERERPQSEWRGAMTLDGLWRERVEREPDAVALREAGDGAVWTVTRLDELAASLASRLAGAGVGRGDVVAVHMDHGPCLIAGLLAIWRLGAVFAPLGPTLAQARRRLVLDELRPRIVLSDAPSDIRNLWRGPICDVNEAGEDAALAPPLPAHGPNDVFAIYFTSGSTGRPKGVRWTHGAIANRLRWQWSALPYGHEERICARSAIDFGDMPVEILGPLLGGAELTPLPRATADDPATLIDAIARFRATRLLLVPSLLAALLDRDGLELARLTSVRLWSTSGEPLPRSLAARFAKAFPSATLINVYGSTEVTADAAWSKVDPSDDPPPVGRPIANVELRVLDHYGLEAPPGVPGRLIVCGAAVAAGYVGDPEGDAARFPRIDGERVCDTGDRAFRRADGAVVVLGRADRVIKIRGQRVDLREVEDVLRDLAQGAAVAVFAIRRDDETTLAGVIETGGGRSLPAVDAIARNLSERLPKAAVPSRLVGWEKMPRSVAGKIDIPRLRAELEAGSFTDERSGEPARLDAFQQRIAGHWRDVLGQREIALDDDFFLLGGSSLSASRLAARLSRDLGARVPLSLVFQNSTLAAMARVLEREDEFI